MTTPADVIVIGAGAAGLSAARALRAAGLQVVVLEAADHIGGRCVTDHDRFSVPFDRGGSWLHAAATNPLTSIAEDLGLSVHDTPWGGHDIHVNGTRLTQGQADRFGQDYVALWDAINGVEEGAPDRSALQVAPPSEWQGTVLQSVGQWCGADADQVSCLDNARSVDVGGDWLVEGGLGALVARIHADVPVQLGVHVRRIDMTGAQIEVTTDAGTLGAPHVIVTVSTGVLAAEAITFDPPLPDAKLRAISQLPNGLLNKVALDMDPDWSADVVGAMTEYHPSPDMYCAIAYAFAGTHLAVGFTGGRCADALEAEGPGAAAALCRDALQASFGSGVLRYLRGVQETAWRSDPLTLGSYSYAVPGGADARSTLAEPVEGRLFFAGEATIPHAYGTVHGAFISGQRAAQQVIDSGAVSDAH